MEETEQGTYRINITCNNCGYSANHDKPKGLIIGGMAVICPNCECLTAKESKYLQAIGTRGDTWYLPATTTINPYIQHGDGIAHAGGGMGTYTVVPRESSLSSVIVSQGE